MFQGKSPVHRVMESDPSVKRRLSFVKRLRSLTTGSARKHSPSQRKDNTVTSPTPSAPPPSSSSSSSSRLSIGEEGWRDQASSPRVHPSHSGLSRTATAAVCCGCSQSHHASADDAAAAAAAVRPADLPLSSDPANIHTPLLLLHHHHPPPESLGLPPRIHALKEDTATSGSVSSSSSMRKRVSSGSDLPQKGAAVTFSKRSSSREKVSGSKSLLVSEEGLGVDHPRSGAHRAESSPSRGEEAAVERGETKGERERDRSTSREAAGRARIGKYVCVVAPSDSKMLRRAYSEKAKGGGGEMTASKTAPLSRHASISARKSMITLAVEQGSSPETEKQGTERAESPLHEPRKSATSSSTNGSVSSHTPDTVVTLLQDSIPKLPPDIKKVEECYDLPSYVSKSKNAKFHKLFKNVPLHEYPIDTYSCAFKGDILLQGVMYVSQNWICFYSKIRARGRLLEIPLEKVISITREKLALIIPNAIGIQVADHKYVFGSFMSRDNTYKLLVTLLKHSQDSVSLAGRRSLSSPAIRPDRVTHSADVSDESDTTEDDDDNNNNNNTAAATTAMREREVVVGETGASSPTSSPGGGSGEGGERSRLAGPPPDKVPGFFSWKCMDYRKMALAISSFTVKLQKVPRTNLLLAVCSVMVIFLLLSAAGLTYKIVLLQTRLEMSPLWKTARQIKIRDGGGGPSVQWDGERATLHHMHDVLKANLQLLEQVHQSLKNLQVCTTKKDCPPVQ